MYVPVVDRLSSVKRTNVDWLWWPVLAQGKMTMLSGDPGVGKSYMSCDLASRITQGKPMPWQGALEKPKRGDVLFLSAEDDMADTVAPRLESCNADLDRIHMLHWFERDDGDVEHIDLSRHAELIRNMLIQNRDIRLLVIDPLSAYLGNTESNNNAAVRAALHPLQCVAHETGVSVLLVSHLRKESAKNPIYATIGSLAFTAAARLVWLVKTANDDSGRSVLYPVKVNLCNAQWAYVYEISDNGVSWTDRLEQPDGARLIGVDPKSADPVPDTKIERCVEFLKSLLEDGPAPSKIVAKAAEKEGFKRTLLHLAGKRLGVENYKDGGFWWSRLPEQGQDSTPTPPDD